MNKENKVRFFKLIEKYKNGLINRSEYLELIRNLDEPEIEGEVDKVLDHVWKTMKSISPSESPNSKSLTTNSSSRLTSSKKSNDFPNQRLFQSLTHRLNRSVWWGIAASLIVVFGIFLSLYNSQSFLKNQEVVYITGYGERQQITLNDGSHITLNANSEFHWNENWKSSGKRECNLIGEAFFEVEKQNGIPFTVHTEDVLIEVIGTSFNVKNREKNTNVYLDEGKVNLKLLETADDTETNSEREITMKPGDQIRYSASKKKIEKTEGQSMISAAAWKNNVLNFKNMKFSEVLDLLRDIYGQSFECSNGELLRTPMYLGVPYSDWEAVRQALELSLNIEFQRVENRRYKVIRIKN